MKKIISDVMILLAIIFMVWMVISFIDVNMNNLNSGQLSWWNIFTLIS